MTARSQEAETTLLVREEGSLSGMAAKGVRMPAVRQLAGGGVLVQATEDYRDYDEQAGVPVFRTVAPLLLPGAPIRRPHLPDHAPVFLVYEDPAAVSSR